MTHDAGRNAASMPDAMPVALSDLMRDGLPFAMHVRTDERTNVRETHPESDGSSFVTRGSEEPTQPSRRERRAALRASRHKHYEHKGHHIYAVYWPDAGVLKIGMSERARWTAWLQPTGLGVLIGVTDICCLSHSHRVEKHLLRTLASSPGVRRAFTSATQAHAEIRLGNAGYTECYYVPTSDEWGRTPRNSYDYERGYGLLLPAAVVSEMKQFNFAWNELSTVPTGAAS